MIALNEPNQYNWTISYRIIYESGTDSEVLIEGKYYDFIPNRNDAIVIDDEVYMVGAKLYDFDTSTIVVSLIKRQNNIQKPVATA